MPRIVRTARGELIDFDTVIIKNQLAQAPMNIEVARRKEFIDSKEGKSRAAKKPEEVLAQDVTQEVVADPVAEPTVVVTSVEELNKPAKASKKK
jgi:hypothetical protein